MGFQALDNAAQPSWFPFRRPPSLLVAIDTVTVEISGEIVGEVAVVDVT
jgi:hypothetical protein